MYKIFIDSALRNKILALTTTLMTLSFIINFVRVLVSHYVNFLSKIITITLNFINIHIFKYNYWFRGVLIDNIVVFKIHLPVGKIISLRFSF